MYLFSKVVHKDGQDTAPRSTKRPKAQSWRRHKHLEQPREFDKVLRSSAKTQDTSWAVITRRQKGAIEDNLASEPVKGIGAMTGGDGHKADPQTNDK